MKPDMDAAPGAALSLLASSAWQRLAAAAVVLTMLWLAVVWALQDGV